MHYTYSGKLLLLSFRNVPPTENSFTKVYLSSSIPQFVLHELLKDIVSIKWSHTETHAEYCATDGGVLPYRCLTL